jgi:calcineurin-like phosphoesterase family protein
MKLQIDLTQGKKVVNVFFTSDFHLFHHNVLKFDKRPFSDVYAMHDYIEKKWNETVTEDDIVIYLGDLSFAKAHERQSVNDFVSRLNGKIHFVIGNHDKYEDIVRMKKFESVQDYLELKITHFETKGVGSEMLVKTDTSFSLMHYPIYSWNKKHHGNYMVHGHSHMGLSESEHHSKNRIIDVGCMGYDYTPISYKFIIEKLKDVEYLISNNHH